MGRRFFFLRGAEHGDDKRVTEQRYPVILCSFLTLCLSLALLTHYDGIWVDGLWNYFDMFVCFLWLLFRSGWGPSIRRWYPVSLFYFHFDISLFFSVGCWSVPILSVDLFCDLYLYLMPVHIPFDLGSCLRTGLQVSHSDACSEYDDLATSNLVLHREKVLCPTSNTRYIITKATTATQPLVPSN